MFFVKTLEHRIDLHPSFFSASAPDFIREKLYQDVEGTNTGTFMIIAVLQIDDISEPKIAPGTGFAQYNVGYRAMVWRPFRGEVVDGKVTNVVNNGFFADVGGLAVFVSKTMLPPSMKHNAEGSTPSWSEADGMIIEKDSQVRLRIKGIRGELGQMYAIGSIREDYLGALLQ